MPWTTIPTSHAGGEDPDATPSCHHYVTMLQLAPVDSGTNTPNGSPAAPYPVAGRRVSDPLVECGIWIRFRPAHRSGPVEACTPGEWSGNNPRPPTEFDAFLYSGRVERKWWKAGLGYGA